MSGRATSMTSPGWLSDWSDRRTYRQSRNGRDKEREVERGTDELASCLVDWLTEWPMPWKLPPVLAWLDSVPCSSLSCMCVCVCMCVNWLIDYLFRIIHLENSTEVATLINLLIYESVGRRRSWRCSYGSTCRPYVYVCIPLLVCVNVVYNRSHT